MSRQDTKTVPSGSLVEETETGEETGINKKEAVPAESGAPIIPGIPPVDPPPPPKPPVFELPPDIPAEPFEAFVAMRAKVRKPMTDYAKELLVLKLRKLHAAGEDMTAVLDQSTEGSWTKIYPLKTEGDRNARQSPSNAGSVISQVVKERADGRFAFGTGGDDSEPLEIGREEGDRISDQGTRRIAHSG